MTSIQDQSGLFWVFGRGPVKRLILLPNIWLIIGFFEMVKLFCFKQSIPSCKYTSEENCHLTHFNQVYGSLSLFSVIFLMNLHFQFHQKWCIRLAHIMHIALCIYEPQKLMCTFSLFLSYKNQFLSINIL